MSEKFTDQDPSPVGFMIGAYQVRGQERDSRGNWVGADLEVRVETVGRYFLRVVTKGQYAIEQLERVHSDLANPERLLDANVTETKEPFVVNDDVITQDILLTKFGRRVVAEDLAASLWYEGPLEQANNG